MENGDGFVLVYSIITQKTFQEIESFIKQIYDVKQKDPVCLHIKLVFFYCSCNHISLTHPFWFL